MTSLYLLNNLKNFTYVNNLLRYGILGLLLLNLAFFSSSEMTLRCIDALGWLLILVFIEWKLCDSDNNPMTLWQLVIQIVALGMIFLSCGNSFIQQDWVSLANELTWLCVLLLPEYAYIKYKFLKFVLYISLVVYAIYWGIHHEWLDCYDAVLWITAFLQLEYEKNDSFSWSLADNESSFVHDDVVYNANAICA